eukprot:Tamp_29557.p1 GENE.Tamp_29557~~Tamp_29557.p1  ORF type:complete len:140 (+),score=27.69 Tamp_29557:32-421(+)
MDISSSEDDDDDERFLDKEFLKEIDNKITAGGANARASALRPLSAAGKKPAPKPPSKGFPKAPAKAPPQFTDDSGSDASPVVASRDPTVAGRKIAPAAVSSDSEQESEASSITPPPKKEKEKEKEKPIH